MDTIERVSRDYYSETGGLVSSDWKASLKGFDAIYFGARGCWQLVLQACPDVQLVELVALAVITDVLNDDHRHAEAESRRDLRATRMDDQAALTTDVL